MQDQMGKGGTLGLLQVRCGGGVVSCACAMARADAASLLCGAQGALMGEPLAPPPKMKAVEGGAGAASAGGGGGAGTKKQ